MSGCVRSCECAQLYIRMCDCDYVPACILCVDFSVCLGVCGLVCINVIVTQAGSSLSHTLTAKFPHVSRAVASGSLWVLNRLPKVRCHPQGNPCILGTPKCGVTNFSCGLKQIKANIKMKPM